LLERPSRGRPPLPQRARRWVQNHHRELTLALLLLIANLALFTAALRVAAVVPTEAASVRLARAFGRCVALDVGLVFVPVTRRMLTRLRGGVLGRVLPLDSAIDFHRVLGHAVLALCILHAAAATLARGQGHGWGSLFAYLGLHVRGLTGSLALLVLCVMWLCALPFVRRSQRFELFYFTHLGYVAFVLLLVAHAPSSLLFAGLPLAGFAVEGVWRHRVRAARVPVVALQPLRSGVTRVEVERPPGFAHRAGDFAFLNIPALAKHEWHPFTISSAPERENLVFHVRSLGNFTAALRAWAERRQDDELGWAQLDGPHGTPSAQIVEARVAVLIGAGIGVTPFASVLESIMLRARSGDAPLNLEKVHFVWLNRDAYAFEWFGELLMQLEAMDDRELLEIDIRMTGGRSGATAVGLELARRAQRAGGARDVITGLSALTRMGHPDWDELLGQIAARHAPTQVDVFFCGPPGLAPKVSAACERHAMRFHEERF